MPTEGHGPSGIYLIILTDGVIVWDTAAQDFDWEITTAIPSCLKGVFPSEPLYADFRPRDQAAHTSTQIRITGLLS